MLAASLVIYILDNYLEFTNLWFQTEDLRVMREIGYPLSPDGVGGSDNKFLRRGKGRE